MATNRPMATPEEVFRNGWSFEHSAQVLAQAMVAARGGPFTATAAIGDAPTGMVPLIVCATFSVELYLKSLIWLETGAPARGHNLEALFGLLPPTRQARIQHNYEQVVSRNKTSIEA